MKLKDLRDQINEIIEARPEAADMETLQTSCFDNPYRFDTSGIYIGEAYRVEDGSIYMNKSSAQDDGGKVEDMGDVVVIEAF